MSCSIRLFALAACTVALLGSAPAPIQAETVLRRGNASAVGTLDPNKSDMHQDANVLNDLFEGLLSLDGKGQPRPGAAQRWEISPDGLIYTFHLRTDAKWSDGSPVTAEDFVFAWRRLADPATAASYGYFVWPIVNGMAIGKGEKKPEELGVEAVDAHTLRVRLEKPAGYFLAQLQHPAMAPLHRESLSQHGPDFTQPGKLVSNGAYRLAENVPQSHIKLVRNPHYYDAAQVKIDAVYFHVAENLETEFKRFRAGEFDVTYTLPTTQVAWARDNMPEAYRPTPTYATFYISPNQTREPWKSNLKLRAALSLAIDREAIANKVLRGDMRPAYSFVPPGEVGGYTPPLPDWAGLTQAERDARAKALLAEAGYGPGGRTLPPIEVVYSTSENNRNVLIAIAAMWKQKLGIETQLNNQEGRVVSAMGSNKSYKDLHFFSWIGDYPDPVSFLQITRSDVTQLNFPAYDSPDYDRLIDEADVTLDAARRLELLRRAEARLLEDHGLIPVFHNTRRRLVSPKVKGWHPNPLDFNLTRYLEIAP